MKTISIILLATTMLIAPTMAQAKQRVGTVDFKKVYDNFTKNKTSGDEIKKEQTSIDKENNAKLAAIHLIADKISTLSAQIDAPATDEETKATLQKERSLLAHKGKAMEHIRRKWFIGRNESVNGDMKKMMHVIVRQLRAKVSDVAKEEGYTLVLDSSGRLASQTPFVLFSEESIDITDLIIKKLKSAK